MKVDDRKTIYTKNIPYCIVANSEESQLIFHVYNSDCLETYSFNTMRSSLNTFPRQITTGNCLISLGTKGVLLDDTSSSNIYIFKPTDEE